MSALIDGVRFCLTVSFSPPVFSMEISLQCETVSSSSEFNVLYILRSTPIRSPFFLFFLYIDITMHLDIASLYIDV